LKLARSTPEGKFKDTIVEQLEALRNIRYPLRYMLTHDDMPGVPDILGTARSYSFAWELKIEGGKATARQHLYLLEEALAMGQACILTLCKDDLVKCERYLYGGRKELITFPAPSHAVCALLPDVPLAYPKRQTTLT
jgi:hypothetical protein